MRKKIEDFQYTVGIILLLLLVIKMTKWISIDSFLLIFATPLTLILVLIAFYHLISNWKISKLLSVLLFILTMVEFTALTAILFSLFFWPGEYVMLLSAMGFYIFAFFSITIFYFLSQREIVPFKDYVTELEMSEEETPPGIDAEIDRPVEKVIVPLQFEWIKFCLLFLVLLIFFLLPINLKIDLFTQNPSLVRAKILERHYKEKESFHKPSSDLKK